MADNSDVPADFLLIGGGFFDYAKEIVRSLAQRGRKAVWFEDRPALDTLTKSTLRLAPKLVTAKSESYFDGIIAKIRTQPIADVLVIKGEALSPSAIERFRAALPSARFTLYFWDSYRNMPKDSASKVAFFDRAFTFDPLDARADPRLIYRPLFYVPEYGSLPRPEPDIDLLFIGTAHSDRYNVLQRLSKTLPSSIKFEKFLYSPSQTLYTARRIFDPRFWRARHSEFTFKPLTRIDIRNLVSRTRAVVDIERTNQCGLTMRTVEMFGAGKKLVTTNRRIMETDLFNPSNIAIIDRRRPALNWDFLNEAYVQPPKNLLIRYSLAGWLNEVLPDQSQATPQ